MAYDWFSLELEKDNGKLYSELKKVMKTSIDAHVADLNERHKEELNKLRESSNNPDLVFLTTFGDVLSTLEVTIANAQGLCYAGVFNKSLKEHLDVAVNTVEAKFILRYGHSCSDRFPKMIADFLEKYKTETEEKLKALLKDNPEVEDPFKYQWGQGE